MKSRVNLNASKDRVGSQQIFVQCLLEAYPVLAEGISHIESLILKPWANRYLFGLEWDLLSRGLMDGSLRGLGEKQQPANKTEKEQQHPLRQEKIQQIWWESRCLKGQGWWKRLQQEALVTHSNSNIIKTKLQVDTVFGPSFWDLC